MISTENMQSIELLIVNRWGNLMATIEDLNGGWDGKTPNGNDAKEAFTFTNILLLDWMVQNGLDTVF